VCSSLTKHVAHWGDAHIVEYGVNDGTRTRDRQGHNLELYHLSYVHHVPYTRCRN
jgi:hypothetical protein